MKPLQDHTTLIVVGKWNRHILDVEWLSKNIFMAAEIQVEFSLNLDLPPRFTKDDVRIVVTADRVVFAALQYRDEVLTKMEQMAVHLSTLLPVTPVSALGINFGYREDSPPEKLLAIFEIGDNCLLADQDAKIQANLIKRELKIQDRELNLSMSHAQGAVTFDFNFHFGLKNMADLSTLLNGTVVKDKAIAESLLASVYDLHIEMEEESPHEQ
jgi:hypothetical protein